MWKLGLRPRNSKKWDFPCSVVLSKAVLIFSDTLHELQFFSFRKALLRLSLVGFDAAETTCWDFKNIWFGKMEENRKISLRYNSTVSIAESQGV
jgi:hypothetical protein